MMLTTMLYFDALMAWGSATFMLWFAVTKANGKRPIKLMSAMILLYYALVFTGAIFGWHKVSEIPTFARPVVWLLFLLPVWESIAEMHSHNGHS